MGLFCLVFSQVCQFLKRGADQTVKNFSGQVSEIYLSATTRGAGIASW